MYDELIAPARSGAAAKQPRLDPDIPTPALVVDPQRVRRNWERLQNAFPGHGLHYAVKCNPDESVLRALAGAGAGFEVASLGELAQVLQLGVPAESVIFGNPVRPREDVRRAYASGVRRFTVDSSGEVSKIADVAAGSDVTVRLQLASATGAEFPLRDKFGCSASEAVGLLLEASAQGLSPAGLSFHVGSQCTDERAWAFAIEQSADVIREAAELGVLVRELNIGGGFPAEYSASTFRLEDLAAVILQAERDFLPRGVRLVAEPGRAVVADAGLMVATVIGRAQRDGREWLYLDVGAFTGLIEPFQSRHRLQYSIVEERASTHTRMPFVLGGPTCDGDDVVSECAWLPADTVEGDRVYVLNAGAYSTAYASAFNGFRPPAVHVQPGALSAPSQLHS